MEIGIGGKNEKINKNVVLFKNLKFRP